MSGAECGRVRVTVEIHDAGEPGPTTVGVTRGMGDGGLERTAERAAGEALWLALDGAGVADPSGLNVAESLAFALWVYRNSWRETAADSALIETVRVYLHHQGYECAARPDPPLDPPG